MRTVAQIIEVEQRSFENISCVDILHKLGIKTEKRGGRLVAMCPIHGNTEHRSLTIYPETNTWSCFSAKCINPKDPSKKNGGSNIDLVIQTFKTDYPQAMGWLRKNFNLGVKNSYKPPTKKKTEFAVNIDDIRYYHSLMNQNNKRNYFLKRGFIDKTIDEQLFGWNGEGFVIPIWAGQPQISEVLSIKIRQFDKTKPKYIRLGKYDATIYGLWDTLNKPTIFAFAGELDCRLANQHNLPSFSLIDGANGWSKLPENWTEIYFPNTKKLLMCFDRKESISAAQMATVWEKYKGRFTSKIIHFPPDFEGDDFNEFVLEFGIDKFYEHIEYCPWGGTIGINF